MYRKTVLLIFGGESPEHDVSIMSARNIYAAMDNEKYDVRLCYIDKHGKWWLLNDWVDDVQHNHSGVQIAAVPGTKSFITLPGNNIVKPDVLYVAVHGDSAEDGALQGLAQLLHTPVVGSDVLGHAICWDKLLTKQIVQIVGVPVTPYITYNRGTEIPLYSQCSEKLGSDILFVKPTRAGSSIGVSRVTTAEDFQPAVELAARYSDKVLIEKAIVGRELEVAILGNPPHHKTSGVGEIIPKNAFYSYEEKYAETSQTQVLSKTELDDATAQTIRKYASDAFQALGCKGQARVDFLLGDDGTPYLSEVNTLPGFTDISQYPKLWHEQGIKYPQLIDRLIELALE